MPNVARSGGFTASVGIAALASTFHVDIALHGVGSGVSLAAALQLCAAVPNFRIYEDNLLPNAIREQVLRNPLAFSNWYLEPPAGPGLGVQINDDVVDRFTVARY